MESTLSQAHLQPNAQRRWNRLHTAAHRFQTVAFAAMPQLWISAAKIMPMLSAKTPFVLWLNAPPRACKRPSTVHRDRRSRTSHVTDGRKLSGQDLELVKEHAFAFFGAVPQSILYDNDRCLVARILPDGTRQRTQRFSAMLSHYVVRDRCGRPGKGNDKGAVEGLVGYGRRNFMVPIPSFPDWDAFNDHLEGQCRKRQRDVLRGHKVSIGERLQADLAAMRDLPATPFEACEVQSGQVASTSVVHYRGNDYSVPVAYGHRAVWIKGFVTRVVIGAAAEVIADHPRSYDTGDIVFDPVHYLPLIKRKIMSFDQAAPLQGWELPDAFATLRRLLEARQGKAGKREYVQVLRLLERFEAEVLHLAIKDALRMGAVSFDAIKHLVLCRVERRPPRLDLDVYPFLPRTNIATTSAASYMSLLAGGEA